MKYDGLPTVQTRIDYRLTNFLIENLPPKRPSRGWTHSEPTAAPQRFSAPQTTSCRGSRPVLICKATDLSVDACLAKPSAATAEERSATRVGIRALRTGSTCGSAPQTTSSAAPAPPTTSTRRLCWPKWPMRCRCSPGATTVQSTWPSTVIGQPACDAADRRQTRLRVHHRRGGHPRPPATLEHHDACRRFCYYRALLTGLAKAFRSSQESARAVSCS